MRRKLEGKGAALMKEPKCHGKTTMVEQIEFSALYQCTKVDMGSNAITAVWSYIGTLYANLLVLVRAVTGCDRIVKEITGLRL